MTSLLLIGFWAVPGVTQWENPGIPWSPPERVALHTVGQAGLLLGRVGPVPLVSALAGCVLVVRIWPKWASGIALIVSFAVTLSLCFGPLNPFFRVPPMNDSLPHHLSPGSQAGTVLRLREILSECDTGRRRKH